MKIDRVDGSARVIGGGCDGPWGAEHMRAPLAIMDEPAGHAATWMGCFAIAATALAWMTDIAAHQT